MFVLFSFLWTLTILTLYSLYKIYRKSLSLTKKMKKGFSLEKQMSLILIFMVLGFTFSLFPTIYHNVCFYLYDTSYNGVALYDKSFLISVAFLTTNSVWNFVIYNILNKKFRSAFINIFVKCNWLVFVWELLIFYLTTFLVLVQRLKIFREKSK